MIWGGLRERGHQARRAGTAAVKRVPFRWLVAVAAGLVVADVPWNLKASLPPSRAWQATAALGVMAGIMAFTGVCVLASALVVAPAFLAFLREGGWPKIRRRVAWASGATLAAGGGLAGLVLGQRSMTSAQLSQSWAYSIGVAATGLTLGVALGLWASAAAATAKHLKLAPRARAAQQLLAAVTLTAALAILSANIIWLAAIQSSLAWLLVGVANLASVGVVTSRGIGRAVRKSRRLRATVGRGRRLTRPLSGHTAVTSFDDLRGGLAGGPVGADRDPRSAAATAGIRATYTMSDPSSCANEEDSRVRDQLFHVRARDHRCACIVTGRHDLGVTHH